MPSRTTALYNGRRYEVLDMQPTRVKLRARLKANGTRDFWAPSDEVDIEEPDSPPARRRYEGHDPERHPAQQ